MMLQMALFHSFSWLSSIPLYIYTTTSLSIPLSMASLVSVGTSAISPITVPSMKCIIFSYCFQGCLFVFVFQRFEYHMPCCGFLCLFHIGLLIWWICMLMFSPDLGSLGHRSYKCCFYSTFSLLSFQGPNFHRYWAGSYCPKRSLKLLQLSSIISVHFSGWVILPVSLQTHQLSPLLATVFCWAYLVNFLIYFLILYFPPVELLFCCLNFFVEILYLFTH